MSTGTARERVSALADATAKFLGIDPEQVMFSGSRVSLRADDLRALLELAGAVVPDDDGWRIFTQKHPVEGSDGTPPEGARVRVVRSLGTPRGRGQMLLVSTEAGDEFAVYEDELADDRDAATAEALADPPSRETLLGTSGPEDYVEVERPSE